MQPHILTLRYRLLLMFQRMHGDATVRERAAGPQRHSDKDALGDFFISRASRLGALDVGIDAIRTLGDVRGGHGDQFLGFDVDRPIFKNLGVELLERLKQIGPQIAQFAQTLDAFW